MNEELEMIQFATFKRSIKILLEREQYVTRNVLIATINELLLLPRFATLSQQDLITKLSCFINA